MPWPSSRRRSLRFRHLNGFTDLSLVAVSFRVRSSCCKGGSWPTQERSWCNGDGLPTRLRILPHTCLNLVLVFLDFVFLDASLAFGKLPASPRFAKVASVAIGANYKQCVEAFAEAEKYDTRQNDGEFARPSTWMALPSYAWSAYPADIVLPLLSILFWGWTSTPHVLFSLYRASLFQDRLTRCIYNSGKDAVTQSKSISPRFHAEVARKKKWPGPRPRHSEEERRLPQKTLLSAAAFFGILNVSWIKLQSLKSLRAWCQACLPCLWIRRMQWSASWSPLECFELWTPQNINASNSDVYIHINTYYTYIHIHIDIIYHIYIYIHTRT